jgi:hypothetical protein
MESQSLIEYNDERWQKIRNELDENNSNFVEVINQYPNLEFHHIWQQIGHQKPTFEGAFFGYGDAHKHVGEYLNPNRKTKIEVDDSSIDELIQKTIKNPINDKTLNKKEVTKIYEALSQIFVQ